MADKKLAQLEYDKFLLKDSSNNVSPIAVVNPDGTNVGGSSNTSNVTLNPGPNQIGSVTVSNVVPINDNNSSITVDWVSGATVGVSSLPALPTGANWIGLVTANIVGTVNTGMLTLFPGPNQIGSVTVANTVPVTGTFWQATQPVSFSNVTLNTGPNQIGSVTISNSPSLGAGANNIGLVTVLNTVPVTGTFWQATQPVSFSNVTLNTGPNQIGSVTISNSPSLGAGSNNIGLVTVLNTVPVTGTFWQTTQPISFTGNITLNPGPNAIGLVTVSNNVNVIPTANISLNASNAFIGLVTVVEGTVYSSPSIIHGMVSSASGSLVQFPNNATRWFLVRASSANATTIYVGGSAATINNGYPLDPGESVSFAHSNTNLCYLVGVGTSEVRYQGGN